MIVKEYIKNFEKLGFGLFVHFGLYSLPGRGEWSRNRHNISKEAYDALAKDFCPDKDWAKDLAAAAKQAGCRYMTLTTRHHDGFSLFDTCGLSDFDAPHCCGRDLVREFVDACRANDIIPFFYHTLLDWREETYNTDFPAYLTYLRASVELLCKNYGKIGGLWFDGMWDKWDKNWEEDLLYGAIRALQPEAMIINNTGLGKLGELGHMELDGVTFERGRPLPINMDGAPKYVASEMCQVLDDHWGYARRDLNYKSTAAILEDLCVCRRYGSNFLLNVGPMGNGQLRMIDRGILEILGQWMALNGEAIGAPRPSGVEVSGNSKNFLLQKDGDFYLFVHDVGIEGDENVTLQRAVSGSTSFCLDRKIRKAIWLDCDKAVDYTQEGDMVTVDPLLFGYGENMVVRVAKFTT